MSALTDWIERAYDDYVRSHPDGQKIGESRAAILEALRAAILSGELEPPDLLEALAGIIRSRLSGLRDARRASLPTVAQIIRDCLAGGTLLDSEDLLDQAYPLGTPDGIDKALRHWTQDDWLQSVVVRYREAAEQTAAAAAWDLIATDIASFLSKTGKNTGEAVA